jgi:ribosomal protein S3
MITHLNKEKQKLLKWKFKYFFDPLFIPDFDDSGYYTEDCSVNIPYNGSLRTDDFKITNIEFETFGDVVRMHITLERPGLLIGKAGVVIADVTKHLNDQEIINNKIEIHLHEANIWN